MRVGAEGTAVAARQMAWFDPEQAGTRSIAIEAQTPAFVIVYSGRPGGEPVVFGDPFLMTTPEENARAMADFQAGASPHPDDPPPTDAATRR